MTTADLRKMSYDFINALATGDAKKLTRSKLDLKPEEILEWYKSFLNKLEPINLTADFDFRKLAYLGDRILYCAPPLLAIDLAKSAEELDVSGRLWTNDHLSIIFNFFNMNRFIVNPIGSSKSKGNVVEYTVGKICYDFGFEMALEITKFLTALILGRTGILDEIIKKHKNQQQRSNSSAKENMNPQKEETHFSKHPEDLLIEHFINKGDVKRINPKYYDVNKPFHVTKESIGWSSRNFLSQYGEDLLLQGVIPETVYSFLVKSDLWPIYNDNAKLINKQNLQIDVKFKPILNDSLLEEEILLLWRSTMIEKYLKNDSYVQINPNLKIVIENVLAFQKQHEILYDIRKGQREDEERKQKIENLKKNSNNQQKVNPIGQQQNLNFNFSKYNNTDPSSMNPVYLKAVVSQAIKTGGKYQNFSPNHHEFGVMVYAYVSEHPFKTAFEIADSLNAPLKDVNTILYKYEGTKFYSLKNIASHDIFITDELRDSVFKDYKN